MLKLEVLVPLKRDRAAVATLYDGSRRLRQDAAAGTAAETFAAAHGNPQCDPLRPSGHPPFGTYRLLKRAPAPAGAEKEYGADLLVFEAEAGPALEAESFGRFGLLVYTGSSGADGSRRRTQGGVRLGKGMMQAILERLGPRGTMQLSIEALDAPVPWWKFWARREPLQTAALSPDSPRFTKPPLDELSLLASLVMPRAQSRPSAADDRDWRDRDTSSSSGGSDRPSGNDTFRGGGGGYSGGGASGSWGDAPAGGGRAPGVDSAGRILGAAAVAAAVSATHAAADGVGEPASESAGATNDDGETGSEAGSHSGDSGTSTGTAY
jgi:hypothetical protein